MFLTIIVFILILSVLILSHELGHFISAKKLGAKVEEFGFGFPPRIFGIKKGETLYSLNLIPFGGFVKIYGEGGDGKKVMSKRAFCNKPIWQRAIILSMGVIMNLLVAVILLSFVHGIGAHGFVEEGQEAIYKNIQVQILEVTEDSPAEKAGLRMGDIIKELSISPAVAKQSKAIDSRLLINEVEDVQKFTARYAGEKITLTIQRGKEVLEKSLTPRITLPKGEGPIGILLAKVGVIKYPWYKSIWLGLKTTGELIITFIQLFYKLIKTLILEGTLIGEVTGPVGIAVLTSQITKLGLIYILQFTAIISINLAIINIIPIPALDGGRLLFLLIEKIKGSPINIKIEQTINSLGFILLIALMILVTFRDIVKLF